MKGITVTLTVNTSSAKDVFGNPTKTTSTVNVENVLVGEPTSEDITNALSLHGKKVEYVLGIPKGDTHIWTDTTVLIKGKLYETIGEPVEGQEDLVPTPWHKKVKVGRYG